MTAPQLDRPALVLPDRRMVRRPHPVGNTMPWHPVSNPFGVAGVVLHGPQQVQR